MANTSAALSEVGVANMAAAVLSEATITSLDDDTALARFMAREFGYQRDEFLQTYPWHFALTRAALAQNADAPAYGWTYAYQLPAACVRLLPITADGSWSGAPIAYELESRQILTDYATSNSTLYVRYIRRETNLAKWSPLAARALGARLAVTASLRMTGKAQYFEKAREAYSSALWEAQQADALERGTPEPIYTDGVLSVREPA